MLALLGRRLEGEVLRVLGLLGRWVTWSQGSRLLLLLLGARLAWVEGLEAVELLGSWVRGPEGEHCCRTTPTCPALSLWLGCGPSPRTWIRQVGPLSPTPLMTLK